jgi:hypothetical protein
MSSELDSEVPNWFCVTALEPYSRYIPLRIRTFSLLTVPVQLYIGSCLVVVTVVPIAWLGYISLAIA